MKSTPNADLADATMAEASIDITFTGDDSDLEETPVPMTAYPACGTLLLTAPAAYVSIFRRMTK